MKLSSLIRTALMFVLVAAAAAAALAQPHKTRVLIIVTSADKFASGTPTGTWLEEFAVPYQMMLKQGYELTVVSPKGGVTPIDPRSAAKPEQAAEWADAIKAANNAGKLTSALKAKDYDAVFVPGGHGPLFDLATDKSSIALISAIAREGKPVASVCHGPAALVGVTLANGNSLFKGKKVTAFSDAEEKAADPNAVVPFSVEQKLIALGGSYTKGANFSEYAVEDGKLILGQNPPSSKKVAQLLINQLEAAKSKGK